MSLFVQRRSELQLRTRLAERVREALRKEILAGRWERRLPSERHLSREFEVGRPTLHLALRSLAREGIVRGAAGKPWEVVGHRPLAPPAPKRRAEAVFLRNARVKPDLTSVLPFIDTLRQKLHRIGFDLLVVDALMHGTKRLEQTLSDIDAEHRPSFYLPFSVPPAVHRWYQKQGVPTLIFGSRTPDVRLPAIEFDPVSTMRHAVEYLFRHGHRRIGLLLPTLSGVGDLRSQQTFRESCARHAAEGMQGTVQFTQSRPAAVKAAVRKFFERLPAPTAIIGMDLELVIGAYATLGEMGLSIPRKVSVLSTVHSPIIDYLVPMPTCYRLPWDKSATLCLRIINDYLRLGVWPDRFHNLLPTLREGESVSRVL